jgi:16S rRNA C1402 (ribose-2'-O) methylase RsmI
MKIKKKVLTNTFFLLYYNCKERGDKMKEALRKNAKNYANQDFLETLLFYFGEYRTEVTPNTIAKIFSEECAKVAFELTKEYNEDDDDYVIPTKKDLTSEVKSITIVLEREETKR